MRHRASVDIAVADIVAVEAAGIVAERKVTVAGHSLAAEWLLVC